MSAPPEPRLERAPQKVGGTKRAKRAKKVGGTHQESVPAEFEKLESEKVGGTKRDSGGTKRDSAAVAAVLSMALRGPHAAVAKLVKAADPAPASPLRVLEIGVGDGQRSLAVVAALTAKRTPGQLLHCVIDTFEMSDGPIAMRDFNRLVRRTEVKPQLFPMPTTAGLTRVAHTLGAVDVILDSDSFHETPEAAKLLAKVMHSSTVLLAQRDGKWSRIQDSLQLAIHGRRAA